MVISAAFAGWALNNPNALIDAINQFYSAQYNDVINDLTGNTGGGGFAGPNAIGGGSGSVGNLPTSDITVTEFAIGCADTSSEALPDLSFNF